MIEIPSRLRSVWTVAGVVGAVVSVLAGIGGAWFLWSASGSTAETIGVASDTLVTVGETASVLDATFSEVSDSLRDVQITMSDGAVTLTQVAAVTADLTETLTEEVPASLESVSAAMPGLISTANVVDGTMRALRFVGVDYDPAVPLDEALAEIDAALAPLPESLRSQGPLLDSLAGRISDFGGDALATTEDIAAIRARLNESEGLLTDYSALAESGMTLLTELETRVEVAGRLGAVASLVVGLTLAIIHTLPLYFVRPEWFGGSDAATGGDS